MKLIEIFHFQDETSITMEGTSPNTTNGSNANLETKMSQVTDFILFLILSLIGAVFILALGQAGVLTSLLMNVSVPAEFECLGLIGGDQKKRKSKKK